MIKRDVAVKLLGNAVPFGILMGIFQGSRYGVIGGVVYGTIMGLLFGAAMTAFFNTFIKKVERELRSTDGTYDGENIIFEGPANHFLKFEGRGGWLTLTANRMVFRSHGKNIQNSSLEIPVAAIKSVQKTMTAKIIDNGLSVELIGGEQESFVVSERDKWFNAISELKNT